MKITIKVALICSIIWIFFKNLYHIVYPDSINLNFPIITNLLFLTISISIGLYLQKKKEGFISGNLLSDIKNGLTSGMIYSLTVSVFIFIFYSAINPTINEKQIDEASMSIYKAVNDPKQLKELKKTNSSFEVMDKKQITIELLKGPKMFYNAKSTFIITLLCLLIFSTLLSILISVIYRNILLR